MPIDFNLIQSLKPNNEIASISNLLGAFAENRARKQQADQAAAFQQRQFEAQQANIAADNARADAQMSLQEREHQDALESAKAKQQREEQQGAYKALPDVMAMAGDRPQAAQAMAAGAGIQMQQQPRDIIDETTDVLDNRVTAPRYSFAVPHSPNVLEYDTGEGRRAQKAGIERNVEDTRAAVAPLSKMPHSSRVAPVAEALARGGGKPEDAVKGAVASAQFGEGIESREKNARTAAGQRAGATADTAAARATSVVERAVVDADKVVDWKGLVQMDNSLKATLANASAPGVLSHRDAQIQLARAFRGTTPTEGEMHLLYKGLGGTMDKWDQFWAAAETGDLSPRQMAELKSAATNAQGELDNRKARAFKALRAKFSSPTYEVMRPQINAELKARAAAVGWDLPDGDLLAETGGNAPRLLGGSHPRSGGTSAPPKARKSPEDWVKEFSQ